MIYSLKIMTGYSRSTGHGRLAQMDRALASEAIGREFESLIAHQNNQIEDALHPQEL